MVKKKKKGIEFNLANNFKFLNACIFPLSPLHVRKIRVKKELNTLFKLSFLLDIKDLHPSDHKRCFDVVVCLFCCFVY